MVSIGDKFERLTVVGPSITRGKRYWTCKCVCGNVTEVWEYNLPRTKSCGCYQKEFLVSRKIHGMSKTPVYNVWVNMRDRCNRKSNPRYKDYGGRGITVCEEWNSSFEAFYKDMGDPPKGLQLDREDNNLGYYKDNCRWTTRSEQAFNRRPKSS